MKQNILIVDDDKDICLTLSKILNSKGFQVTTANNSDAAITVTTTSNGSTAADLAVGHVATNNASTNVVAVVDVLTFVHNKATAGDRAMCVCDGTNWFFDVVGDAAGSITLA